MSTKETAQPLQTSLPYKTYVSQEIFDTERKKIFSKNWIFVGHTSQVKKVGDFFTFEVAGESILVTHANDGNIRAFYNICPHRGTKVEQSETGNKKILQCIYHGWTFNLDGHVNRAPNFKNIDLGEYNCLKSVQLEIQRSMIFVNLDREAAPFSVEYGELVNELSRYSFLDSLQLVKENRRLIKANWKAVVDNFLECDHCPVAHPSFSKTFDLSNYSIVPCDKFSYQCSNVKNQDDSLTRFYWIWPNMMMSVFPGGGNMTTTQLIPIDANQTLAVYRYFFFNEEISKEEEELIKFVDQVREEDFDLVELLQSGLHSKAFENGIFSPTENAMQHFHEMIKEVIDL
ncbi:aromatic ring-hydroxylating dioxygenase subunit alpha [Gottfriedia sp. NPDC058432]|uniref:aromatic ring-hydroxylating oxygenase subunit alpha n=1 Tax=Gottfriedia sp. NPDC058432 TaxID=3346497 RepID=UPI00365A751C